MKNFHRILAAYKIYLQIRYLPNQSRAEVVATEAMSGLQIPALLIFVCSSLSP